MKISSLFKRLNLYSKILYFKFLNFFSKSCGITDKPRKVPVILSLTSYPKRLDKVYLTLESLLNQDVMPDKIILWLSRKEVSKKDLPGSILRLEKRGVNVEFVDTNFKQYNKLIYTLKKYWGAIIITVDDDTLYPNNFISGLYSKYLDDKKCIVAYRATYMEKAKSNLLTPYVSWKNVVMTESSFNLFHTGVGGVLFPPNSLNKEIFNYKMFMRLSPANDDVWFKAMGLLNKTKTVLVSSNSVEFSTVYGTQSQALWHGNVGRNKNDAQLKKVFDMYKLYPLLD
ncbi:MAG: hypothetical protein WC821_00335 [archaeon]|jgi:hypothetical protein